MQNPALAVSDLSRKEQRKLKKQEKLEKDRKGLVAKLGNSNGNGSSSYTPLELAYRVLGAVKKTADQASNDHRTPGVKVRGLMAQLGEGADAEKITHVLSNLCHCGISQDQSQGNYNTLAAIGSEQYQKLVIMMELTKMPDAQPISLPKLAKATGYDEETVELHLSDLDEAVDSRGSKYFTNHSYWG